MPMRRSEVSGGSTHETNRELVARFPEIHPAFDDVAAVTEANRCLYCFDAPGEGACVYHRYNKEPIQIGRLQRYAMDAFFRNGATLPAKNSQERKGGVACIG